MDDQRILIAGESWVTHSVHQKGFDSFTTTAYEEGVGPLRAALPFVGWEGCGPMWQQLVGWVAGAG